jgi:hypothetical protein
MELHLNEQYELDRITGSDYATVYLGMAQSTLKEAIMFSLTQEEAGFTADVAAETVLEAQAKTDTQIAQTAKIYSDVALVDQKSITEQAQTVTPTGGLLLSKDLLVQAQTLGFASDTKQKILKQMFEGYAVTLSIAGVATVPDAATEPAIDALVQEILTDVGSTATVNAAVPADIG